MFKAIHQTLVDWYSMYLFRSAVRKMNLLGYQYMQACHDGGQVRAVTFSQSRAYADEQVKAIPRFIYD